MILHEAAFDELDVRTLYALLKLRGDVFVVEQECPFPELDGRDTEPGTRHLWLAAPEAPAAPQAYLRILIDPHGTRRISRVCTALTGRRAGLSGRLMTAALSTGGPFVLDAQSHLVGFYARFGFVASGPEFLEDGIPHTPMQHA